MIITIDRTDTIDLNLSVVKFIKSKSFGPNYYRIESDKDLKAMEKIEYHISKGEFLIYGLWLLE